MKKILMLAAIITMANLGATAQSKNNCVKDDKKVCKPTADGKGVSCYETKNAQNYHVCKGKAGYYVCCQAPAKTASNNYTIDNNYNVYGETFPQEYSQAITPANDNNMEEENTIAPTDGGENAKQVCKRGANGKTECYKTDYAKNYNVCKDAGGYHICPTPSR